MAQKYKIFLLATCLQKLCAFSLLEDGSPLCFSFFPKRFFGLRRLKEIGVLVFSARFTLFYPIKVNKNQPWSKAALRMLRKIQCFFWITMVKKEDSQQFKKTAFRVIEEVIQKINLNTY